MFYHEVTFLIRKVKKEGLEVGNFIFNPTVLAHCSNAVILVL